MREVAVELKQLRIHGGCQAISQPDVHAVEAHRTAENFQRIGRFHQKVKFGAGVKVAGEPTLICSSAVGRA